MPPVKKDRRLSTKLIEEDKAIAALEIQLSATKSVQDFLGIPDHPMVVYNYGTKARTLQNQFHKKYNHSSAETIAEMWKWYLYIFIEETLSAKEIFDKYIECVVSTSPI